MDMFSAAKKLLHAVPDDQASRDPLLRDLAILDAISEVILQNPRLDDLVPALLGRLKDMLRVDDVALWVREDEELIMHSVHGTEAAVLNQARMPLRQGVAGHIAATGQPHIVADLAKAAIIDSCLRADLCSFLGVPLFADEQVSGVLHVSTIQPRTFTDHDMLVLQVIAERIALGMRHAMTKTIMNEIHYRVIFEANPEGILFIDQAGIIMQVNPQAEAMFGAKQGELCGKNVDRLVPERWQLLHQHLRTDFARDPHAHPMSKRLDLTARHMDGCEFPVEISLSPVETLGNTQFICTVHDITQRRSLEAQTQRTLTSLLLMARALVTSDKVPAIGEMVTSDQASHTSLLALIKDIVRCERIILTTFTNDAEHLQLNASLGLTAAEIDLWQTNFAGMTLDERFTPAITAQLRAHQAAYIDLRSQPFSARPNPFDIAQIVLVPLYIETAFIGVMALYFGKTHRDFSDNDMHLVSAAGQLLTFVLERGQSQREREQLLAALQKKNAELAEQNRLAQEATRAKSEFLANMSHELRTPLNSIMGFAELLSTGEVGAVTDTQHEFLEDIVTSAQHLLQLINSILDLAKIEAGKMEFAPKSARLADLIDEVTTIMQPLLVQKHLRWELALDPRIDLICLDNLKLKQVIYNLLSNAVKFTPSGGQIMLRTALVGETHFRLDIKDEGVGIRAEDLPKLFGAFQQLDNSTEKRYQGTGLGLSLTKYMIEAQAGTIGVQSVFGQGSTFWFTLPLRSRPIEDDEVHAIATTPGLYAPRLLMIEDDPATREYVNKTLLPQGYSVDGVPRGTLTIARLQQRAYDAILLNRFLPDLATYDLVRMIKSDPALEKLPIIATMIVPEKHLSSGTVIQDILPKPVNREVLLASLHRAGTVAQSEAPILVIEDEAHHSKYLTTILTQQGYTTLIAADALTAFRLAEQTPPQLIILDLLMDTINGWEVLDHFARHPHVREVPIIIWSSADLTATARQQLTQKAELLLAQQGDQAEKLIAAIQQCLKNTTRSNEAVA